MVLRNETIDDRQTDIIHYQGSWFNAGAYQATSTGDSGTLSSSNFFDANFTVDTPPILAFYYFGIGRSGGGFYQICIDCDPNNRVWKDIDGLNRTDDGHNPPVALYSIHWGKAGSHEIIITNRMDTRFAGGKSQITLDRLVYTIDDGSNVPNSPGPTVTTTTGPVQTTAPNTPSTQVTNSQPTGSQTSISESSSSQSIGSHTTSNTRSSIESGDGSTGTGVPTSAFGGDESFSQATVIATETSKGIGSGSKSNVSVAAIVGGVVGGILLILVGVSFLLRRRRRVRGQKGGDGGGELSSDSDPNTRTRAGESILVGVPTSHSSRFVTGSRLISKGFRNQMIDGSRGATTGEGWTTIRREEDGGSIHGFGMSEFGGEDGRTLPPGYYDIARHNDRRSEI